MDITLSIPDWVARELALYPEFLFTHEDRMRMIIHFSRLNFQYGTGGPFAAGVFEQNTGATRNRFLALVNPYMENVQQKSGLYAFKVVMDASNNTADVIDRNIMKGEIYLQPSKTSEFIIIDFNVLPSGAAFED